MTPAARLQAAIEVLDEVIASARDDGPPADTIVTRYFKHRRYAGSKDRRAVRELAFRAIRRSADRDRKSTRLNSSRTVISYAVFCLKKKKKLKAKLKIVEYIGKIYTQGVHLDAT